MRSTVVGMAPSRGANEPLPRGSLSVRGPEERIVYRSIPGAFRRDEAPANDALSPVDHLVRQLQLADSGGPPREATDVSRDRVIWGGCIFNEYEQFATTSVSRIWPALPGEELDGLPIVFNRPRYPALGNQPTAPALVDEWLAALDVPQIELSEHDAIRFSRMHIPEPAWRVDSWIAPELRDIHLHVRHRMDLPHVARVDVLWLSRAKLDRNMRAYDEALLEWLLGDFVTPVRPEATTLAQLVGLIESSRAVAGVAGGAFHALLLALDPPDCFVLTSDVGATKLAAQHLLLEAGFATAPVLASTLQMRRARAKTWFFPGLHRVLIPAALEALGSSLLPGLLDDPRIAAFVAIGEAGSAPRATALENELDRAIARVLIDPFAFADRLSLAEMFGDRGLDDCAAEQYAMVADLSEDPRQVDTALRARGAYRGHVGRSSK